MKPITDRQARNIKPGDKPIASGVAGLVLMPGTEKGRGKWRFRFVSPLTARRRDTSFGTFPEVGIADALRTARDARTAIAAGNDPIEQRRALSRIPTFEQAARTRWEQVSPGFRNAKHRAQWISTLETHVFPTLGPVRVDKLTPQQFAEVLRPIWLEIPETASRVLQRCNDTMKMCWAQGHIAANPMDVVRMLLPTAAPVVKHQPAMPWRQVPGFVSGVLLKRAPRGARAALLFAILTAARSGEVRGATWAEIDLDAQLWVVPAERMKAHRPHRVPLSVAAVELLRSQLPERGVAPDALVFPAIRGGKLCDMALSSILRKANAPSDAEGRTATAHGFRSSFRNWCADTGVSTDVAERALAHTIANKVQAAYERSDRLDARKRVMEAWAQHVMGATADNVITMQRAG